MLRVWLGLLQRNVCTSMEITFLPKKNYVLIFLLHQKYWCINLQKGRWNLVPCVLPSVVVILTWKTLVWLLNCFILRSIITAASFLFWYKNMALRFYLYSLITLINNCEQCIIPLQTSHHDYVVVDRPLTYNYLSEVKRCFQKVWIK